jgi:hypothetical protein
MSAGFVQGIEQAGVEALLEEDVGGQGGLHHLLKYSSAGECGCKCDAGSRDSARIGRKWRN